METTLDRFGRVVIPKRVRDDLGLCPGTVLVVEERGRGVNLMPIPEKEPLAEEEGVLIFHGRAAGDLAGASHELREARLADLTTIRK
jgi:AbrB family looped-hinge helix DNA binding protein